MKHTRSTHADTWPEHERRARQLHNEIRALVERESNDAVDVGVEPSHFRQQSSAGALPVVPISPQGITLDDQPIDPYGIRQVPGFMLPVELQKDRITVAYFRQHSKLLSKLRDPIASQIARDFLGALLYGRRVYDRVPLPALPGHPSQLGGERRFALLGSLLNGLDLLFARLTDERIPQEDPD